MKTLKLFLITIVTINSFAQTGFASREGTQYDCDRGITYLPQTTEHEGGRYRGNRDFTLNMARMTSYILMSATAIGVLWPILDVDNRSRYENSNYRRGRYRRSSHHNLHHADRKENSEEWYDRQKLNVEFACLEGLIDAIPADQLYRFSCSPPSQREVRNGYRVVSEFREHVDALPMSLEDAQAHCGS